MSQYKYYKTEHGDNVPCLSCGLYEVPITWTRWEHDTPEHQKEYRKRPLCAVCYETIAGRRRGSDSKMMAQIANHLKSQLGLFDGADVVEHEDHQYEWRNRDNT